MVPAAQPGAALARNEILVQSLPWRDPIGALRVTVGRPGDTDAVLAALGAALP
jgi:hypothetical protein